MRYLSVCSGIEAATVAWHPLGWEAAAYSEIEKFPSQVLAHHYPNTPNVGDMTKFKEWTNVSDVDVLVGGTPCQSFSVAGLRKGLDDPRGNLMLTYLAIAAKYRPKWLVWENVPGVLSSNGGLDFASLLRGMGELGYGFAYRILDAQYFGVAQRRRRVFVVGYAGNWRPAAAVLFERHSMCGYPAPSREKGKSSSKYAGRGIAECSPTIGCELAKQVNNQMIGNAEAFYIPDPIALAENTIGRKPENGGNGDGFTEGGPMYTLNATGVHGVAQPIPFDTTQITSKANGSNPQSGDPCHPLAAGAHAPAIAQAIPIDTMNHIGRGDKHSMGDFVPGAPSYTLTKGHSHAVAQPIAFEPGKMKRLGHGDAKDGLTPTLRANAGDNQLAVAVCLGGQHPNAGIGIDQSPTLTNAMGAGGGHVPITNAMQVRRLSPKECERLQGFPDNYTDIKLKGKPTPDGPRYKALGNSMAVPVMAWIGKRIQEVETLLPQALESTSPKKNP